VIFVLKKFLEQPQVNKLIPFPNISPEIFSINIGGFDFALRWYAISYLAGFFCAIKIMKWFSSRSYLWELHTSRLTPNQADTLLTYLIVGVIIGGRLGYVIFYNLDYYVVNIGDIIRIWDGGMAFHGGFIGVIIAIFIYSRLNSIPLWSLADLIAISSPPGLLFGRIANFINAELWGSPTTLPWGIIFPGGRAQDCGEIIGTCARHPSQLYEACLEGILLFAVLLFFALRGALKRPAFLTGIFAIGYGSSRFFVEYFRVPDPQFFSDTNPNGYALSFSDFGLTMGQLLSLPMIIIGAILIVFTPYFLVKRQ
jgi:phosphatidylglycerol:prolipoprotein diacylglycerol transferase